MTGEKSLTENKSSWFSRKKSISVLVNVALIIGIVVFLYYVKFAPRECWNSNVLNTVRELYNNNYGTEDEIMARTATSAVPVKSVDLGIRDGFRSCSNRGAFTLGPPTNDSFLGDAPEGFSWGSLSNHRRVLVKYKIGRRNVVLEEVQEIPE